MCARQDFVGFLLDVRRMTHLKDTEIQKASKFPQVADRFISWLQHYAGEEAICLYSFGPDDARTLCANAAFYHHGSEQLFAGIVDLQTLLSSRVRWRGEVFHKTHSLESLKQIYRIRGEVNHNALSDAIDLYRIHEAYRMERALDEEAIGHLYRTMRQKQVEGMSDVGISWSACECRWRIFLIRNAGWQFAL